MKREEIKEEYKWDLTKLYPNMTSLEKDLKLANKLLKKLKSYAGKLGESAEQLLEFVNIYEQFDEVFANIYIYTKQLLDVEPNNPEGQQAFAKASVLYGQTSEDLAFIQTEIVNKEKIIKKLIKDKRFADVRFYFGEYLHMAPHTLSLEMENVIAATHSFGRKIQNVFETIRPEFKPVIINGEEHFLNQATLNTFLENKDRSVRKQAYENFYSEYQKLANTFGTVLDGHIKYVSFLAKQQKYSSALQASLYSDNAPVELFEKILAMANKKYRPFLHEYFELKKTISGLDECYNYDLSVPPVEDLDLKFSVEEGLELIYEALAPLGKEYVDLVKQGIKNRWVDFHTHEGKRSGAYSWGSYNSQPYILMNWVGTLDSVYTLAHELGHSMHSYLSNHSNRAINSHYKIFVAEVASTVNEVFLTNHLLKKYANNKQIKTYLYHNLTSDIVGTIYRQPFFAEFERTLYAASESGEPISNKMIGDTYTAMSEDYYGPNIKLAEQVAVSCYSVPHFYYRFYVYKYTIGMSCALTIVKRILAGDTKQRDAYLTFLKSGGTNWPVELLKNAGVDPTSDAVYDEAFNYFAEVVKEYRKLVQK